MVKVNKVVVDYVSHLFIPIFYFEKERCHNMALYIKLMWMDKLTLEWKLKWNPNKNNNNAPWLLTWMSFVTVCFQSCFLNTCDMSAAHLSDSKHSKVYLLSCYHLLIYIFSGELYTLILKVSHPIKLSVVTSQPAELRYVCFMFNVHCCHWCNSIHSHGGQYKIVQTTWEKLAVCELYITHSTVN